LSNTSPGTTRGPHRPDAPTPQGLSHIPSEPEPGQVNLSWDRQSGSTRLAGNSVSE
jgi:hypothetical protein